MSIVYNCDQQPIILLHFLLMLTLIDDKCNCKFNIMHYITKNKWI